jgi:hypothetical protein
MLHDDLARFWKTGIYAPDYCKAPSPPVPRAAPLIRSSLFDELAAYHESGHCVWNHVRREPIHSVMIEGEGLGGGEFKATPTSGTIELRDDDDALTRATVDLKIAGALLDPGTRESWLARLPGFIVPLFAQRRFGAVAKTFDDNCGHDIEVVNRIINVMADNPAERRRLRERVYREAQEFVDQYWGEIEKLGKEILNRGKLNKQEIEEILAPEAPPVCTMTQRARAAYHEASHAVVSARLRQTITSVMVRDDGTGLCRTREKPKQSEEFAIKRFCLVAMAGIVASERIGATERCEGDWAAIKREIALLPPDEQVAFERELRRKAELFVDENWTAICAVAEELHERGSLNNREVRDLLAPPRRAA